MLSKEDNVTLTQVGPGTPGGNLMRMYWQPVAAAKELDDSPFRTKEVRVLGEDLVLFRDRQGKLGLIERFCSHRRVNLAIGVVEDDGLRCQYHGWKFNAQGQCIEQPFEDTMHPEDSVPFEVRHHWVSGTRDGRTRVRLHGPDPGSGVPCVGAIRLEQRGARHRHH